MSRYIILIFLFLTLGCTDMINLYQLDDKEREPEDLSKNNSIIFNKGNLVASSRYVHIDISIYNVDSMSFGDDKGGWTGWINYSTSYNYKITKGNGPRIITAKFRNGPGTEITFTAPITLIEKCNLSTPYDNANLGQTLSSSYDGKTFASGIYTYNNKGAVVIYQFNDSTYEWISSLVSSIDVKTNGYFGSSVSLSGDGNTLAVGAYQDYDTLTAQGKVYIFNRNTGGENQWGLDATLKASDESEYAKFGFSVSLNEDGTKLVVGAENKSPHGSVYLFTNNGTWQQTHVIHSLIVDDAIMSERFGYSVMLSGNGMEIFIGAPNFNANQGRVYWYSWESMTLQSTIVASNGNKNDNFGENISITKDGTSLVVSARLADNNGTDKGLVYYYEKETDEFIEKSIIESHNSGNGYQFGSSCSLSPDGKILVVGSPYYKTSLFSNGAAEIFNIDGESITWIQLIQPLDLENHDQFGNSISISEDGTYKFIGSMNDDFSMNNEGSIYVY